MAAVQMSGYSDMRIKSVRTNGGLRMKKESNAGLFFLLAVGIVGLGLYFGASENYSAGELQLYHILCWVILLLALLRVLELVWEPMKALWDQAWGKAQERQNNGRASFQASQGERQAAEAFRPESGGERRPEYSVPPSAGEEEQISRAEGVIIMPDRSSRLYLESPEGQEEYASYRPVPSSDASIERSMATSVDASTENFMERSTGTYTEPAEKPAEKGQEEPENRPSVKSGKKKDKKKKKKK